MAMTDSNNDGGIAPRWELDTIFAGGSESHEYQEFRESLRQDLVEARDRVLKLPNKLDSSCMSDWSDFVLEFQRLGLHLDTAAAFARCLTSQDVTNDLAHTIMGEIQVMRADWESLQNLLEGLFTRQDDSIWRVFLARPEMQPIAFYLDELRTLATEKMPSELEDLALELAVNGYHAWGRFYDRMSGELTAEFTEAGEQKRLSMGQLQNKLLHADRDVRKLAFSKFQQTWESRAGLAAAVLNNQGGFRLSVYRRRGWDSALHEPLRIGRMKRETLESMWRAARTALPQISRYIEAKKKILGIDRFCWYDQAAPVGQLDIPFTFGSAGAFIVKHFSSFSDELAEFAEMALKNRWVEAEDRPGKADGGFCTGMDLARQSRIFMTYGNDFGSMTTLAHELGHAYHHFVLRDTPFLVTFYPMGLAETASIFSELLVTDAALKEYSDPWQRLMLLDQILQQPFILFCNIYARYLFDCWFYEMRQQGVVGRTELDQLMVKAQEQAFGGILDPEHGYHPLFWASKLHFFITDQPFYNFPYTFGYLFAGGVYARAKREGSGFASKYRALLEDTGRMAVEEVAKKHLDVDLTDPEFWEEAVARSVTYVADFVKLVDELA